MPATGINYIEESLKPASPGLILAALLIWGWQTDLLFYAFIIGLTLELPRFINWRIEFSDKDINQLADISGVLFFIVAVYSFTNHSFQGIYKVLELLPFSLLLLILAQQYSDSNGIKTSALFISVRRLGDKASPDVLYEIDISLPYVFICLIAASSGNKYNDLFFILAALTITWMVWSFKPRQYSLLHWAPLILLASVLAYGVQHGLRQIQENTESLFLNFFEQYGWKSRDPNRISTAIGSLGRLKLSDRIIMRVKSDEQLNTPLYLRETSYSIYEYGIWRNPHSEFDVIDKKQGRNEWQLESHRTDIGKINVGLFLDSQSAIIPAPSNISSLSGKDLIQVETSVYGATRIETREGWINYRLGFSSNNLEETTPDPEDLIITPYYKQDIELVANQLQLYSKTPDQVIETVKKYFKDNFYYSITQNQRYTRGQYLSKFLLENKKGHCEYFATATALLLREAGIPTRYTIGFSLQEYSPWQRMYLVRARHAHSWVSYYINDQWHLIDTTPSEWAPLEAEDETYIGSIMDVISWIRYMIAGGEIEETETNNNWIIWLLIPLGSYLAWRLYHNQRSKKDKNIKAKLAKDIKRLGTDSPAFNLIQQLEIQFDKRRPGESLSKWLDRILNIENRKKYVELIQLHYQYRFKPDADRNLLRKKLLRQIESIQT